MATKEILSLPLTNGDKGVFLARKSAGIYRANMSTSSSATDFKVTADDITELYDGLTIVCKNSVIASAENCTINLNNLGAKRIWLSQSNSYCTTHWAVNQTYIFIYDGTNNRWDLQQGRDTNSNTTYAVFTAPTSSAAGKAGLVPAPASNTMNYVLTASGWKNNASVAYATSAKNATTATNDSAGQQINTTYIKNASVSGKTITFTKGDGSTFNFQTQDTTYTLPTDYMSTATVSGKDITFTLKNGSTFKITTQDTNTTYADFTSPTASVAGNAGLVPSPAAGQQNYILTASGWKNTASAAYATKAGTATYATNSTYASTATYAENIPAQAYVSTATVSGRTITFTRGDGSTFSFQTQDNNTTYAAFTAPTSAAAGKAGLVPAPSSNTMNYILTASGWSNTASAAYATSAGTAASANAVTWANVSSKPSTFTAPTSSAAGTAGFVPAPAKNTMNYILTASGWSNTASAAYATKSGTATYATNSTYASTATYAETIPAQAYVSTATVSGRTITFTRGDGSTFSFQTQDNNTTYANFTVPTSSAAGKAGLVPAPASNTMNYILTASGWSNTASAAYATKAGTATYANSAGTATYAPNQAYVSTATVSGRTITFTKGDGSTFSFQTQDNNTTYAAFTPATTAADGAAGLVPKPTKSQYEYILTAHSWTNTIDCGYES